MFNSINTIYIKICNDFYQLDKTDISYTNIMKKDLILNRIETNEQVKIPIHSNTYLSFRLNKKDKNVIVTNPSPIYIMDYKEFQQFKNTENMNISRYRTIFNIEIKELDDFKLLFAKSFISDDYVNLYNNTKYNVSMYDKMQGIISFGNNKNHKIDDWSYKKLDDFIEKVIHLKNLIEDTKIIDVVGLQNYKFALFTDEHVYILDAQKGKILCKWNSGTRNMDVIFPINKHQYACPINAGSLDDDNEQIVLQINILSETLNIPYSCQDMNFEFI